MKFTKKRGLVGAAGVAALGLLLTACFGANVTVAGKQVSALAPSGTKTIEINLKTKTSLGSPWGGMSGSLKDNGANPAFPYGVKINFNHGMATALGEHCSEAAGPVRRVHAVSTAKTRGGFDPCSSATGYDPRLWFGLVTYSSGDSRHYPNILNPECSYAYTYLQAELLLGLGGLLRPQPKSTGAPDDIVGFGVMVAFDSDANRNIDRNDRFACAARTPTFRSRTSRCNLARG